MSYPRAHAYLSHDGEDMDLREALGKLNQPGMIDTECARTANSMLDFGKYAEPASRRDPVYCRALAQEVHEEKCDKKFQSRVKPREGLTDFSCLWNLPDFSLTNMTYDPMHAMGGCITHILDILKGSITKDLARSQKLINYEHEVNRRYLGWTSVDETPPFVISDTFMRIASNRLKMIEMGAPPHLKGQRWHLLLETKLKYATPKTHDKYVFAGCIGAFALLNLLSEPFNKSTIELLQAFSARVVTSNDASLHIH
ncbi:hypothetical protein BSKO_10918 [Bryopsis sp. KO-2023]|nr:hypothetical protein BSKO_10918 [Bryopsis sp. KO-2023]